MTTTAIPSEVKPILDPMRILSIAANLLPAEITDARRETKLRWIIVAVLVVVVAALGFWDVDARQQTSDAKATLKKTQAQVASLQKSQQQYGQLSAAKSSAAAIQAELTKLMAQDIAWYQVVPAVRTAATTSGVAVTNISGSLSTASQAASASTAGSAGAGTTAAPQVGSIAIVGTSVDKPAVAAFLDQLAKIPGLSIPVLQGINAQGNQYQFTLTVAFSSALYQGRYTPANPTGGK